MHISIYSTVYDLRRVIYGSDLAVGTPGSAGRTQPKIITTVRHFLSWRVTPGCCSRSFCHKVLFVLVFICSDAVMGNSQSSDEADRQNRPKIQSPNQETNSSNAHSSNQRDNTQLPKMIKCQDLFSPRMPAGIVGRTKGWDRVFPFTARLCEETHRIWPYEGTFNLSLMEFVQHYINELIPERPYIKKCFSAWRDAALQNPDVDRSVLETRTDERVLALIREASARATKQVIYPLAVELGIDLGQWGPKLSILTPPMAAKTAMLDWLLKASNKPYLYEELRDHLKNVGLIDRTEAPHQLIKRALKPAAVAAAQTTDDLISYAAAAQDTSMHQFGRFGAARNAGVQTSRLRSTTFDTTLAGGTANDSHHTPPTSTSTPALEAQEQPIESSFGRMSLQAPGASLPHSALVSLPRGSQGPTLEAAGGATETQLAAGARPKTKTNPPRSPRAQSRERPEAVINTAGARRDKTPPLPPSTDTDSDYEPAPREARKGKRKVKSKRCKMEREESTENSTGDEDEGQRYELRGRRPTKASRGKEKSGKVSQYPMFRIGTMRVNKPWTPAEITDLIERSPDPLREPEIFVNWFSQVCRNYNCLIMDVRQLLEGVYKLEWRYCSKLFDFPEPEEDGDWPESRPMLQWLEDFKKAVQKASNVRSDFTQVINCAQGPTEPVIKFIYRFEQTWNRYSGMHGENNQNTLLKVHYLVSALSDQVQLAYKIAVVEWETVDWKATVDKLLAMERAGVFATTNRATAVKGQSQMMQLQVHNNRKDKQKRHAERMAKIKCFKCGAMGHLRRDCPSSGVSDPRNSRPFRNQQTRPGLLALPSTDPTQN